MHEMIQEPVSQESRDRILLSAQGLCYRYPDNVRYKETPLAADHYDRCRLEIGVLFQDPDDQLFGHTVVGDVAFGLQNQGLPREDAQLKAKQALRQVNLEKLAYKEPRHLSYGQKKRAALAGILAMQPEILLLDEPTTNLDPCQEEVLLDLLKAYHGTHALQGMHLSIQSGERIAMVGENGAGKTTLLSCLIGLRQGEGEYFFAGRPMTKKRRKLLWRRVGIVFQDCADQLFSSSVQEEITFGLRRMGCPRSEIQGRISKVLSMVRLEGFENRVPLHLSGGERKRLALACVLAMAPELLILDEPTAGLDPQGQELFLEILKDLETTLLLVSHDMFLVNELTDRTLIMHQGRITQDLATRDFMRDEGLGSMNRAAFCFRGQSSSAIRSLQHEHEYAIHDRR